MTHKKVGGAKMSNLRYVLERWGIPKERLDQAEQAILKEYVPKTNLSQAGEELPKKREMPEHICIGHHGCRACHVAGGNKAIDLSTPIIANYKAKIAGLEKSSIEITATAMAGIVKLKQRISEQAKEIERLKELVKEIMLKE